MPANGKWDNSEFKELSSRPRHRVLAVAALDTNLSMV